MNMWIHASFVPIVCLRRRLPSSVGWRHEGRILLHHRGGQRVYPGYAAQMGPTATGPVKRQLSSPLLWPGVSLEEVKQRNRACSDSMHAICNIAEGARQKKASNHLQHTHSICVVRAKSQAGLVWAIGVLTEWPSSSRQHTKLTT